MTRRPVATLFFDTYAPEETRCSVLNLMSQIEGHGPTYEDALDDMRAKKRVQFARDIAYLCEEASKPTNATECEWNQNFVPESILTKL